MIDLLAHGVGSRGDLPLPLSNFLWGAAIALGISFAALGLLWTTPRLARAAEGRRIAIPERARLLLDVAGRVVVLAMFALTIVAAFVGPDEANRNVAPRSLYVVFWVGVPLFVGVMGDVWSALNPFDTLARIGQRLGLVSDGKDGGAWWFAIASIAAFLWLELAYHASASPRAIGIFLVAYSIAMLAGLIRNGRRWLGRGDGFGALFALIGKLGLFTRRDDETLVRPPLSGTATLRTSTSMTLFVLLVLGSTTFDGVSRTDWWLEWFGDEVGWTRTWWNTLGLVASVAAVVAVYYLASSIGGRIVGWSATRFADTYSHSLIPIVLGYAVAHYFSLLVFDGQFWWIQLSDPFGEGWNLFGTAYDTIDYTFVSTKQIAWVQAAAIVLGHVAGVLIAHDRAIERHRADIALRSQFPMLGAMVVFSLTGLVLLLNA